MSFAALMVHFDAGPNSHHRLRLAVDLANRFEAALIGIAGRSYLPPFLADGNAISTERKNGEQQEMTHVLAEIGEKFHAAAKHVSHVEWKRNPRRGDQSRCERIASCGSSSSGVSKAQKTGITLRSRHHNYSRRPSGSGRTRAINSLEARRIVVAWKDTREARRAIRDAIPFLKGAEEVMIVEICEHGTEAQSQQHINDLKDYLRDHKIGVAQKAYLHTELPVANELLRFAKDEKADLIVAGG